MRLHLRRSINRIGLLLVATVLVYILTRNDSTPQSLKIGMNSKSALSIKSSDVVETSGGSGQSLVDTSFLSRPVVNDFDFRYLYKPRQVCQNTPVDLLVAIQSLVVNFDYRRLVRQTRRTQPPVGLRYLFFIGKSTNSLHLQDRLDAEVNRYQDIVQGDFQDGAHNLSLVSIFMLQWIHTFCPSARWIIMKNDHTKVNLIQALRAFHRTQDIYPDFIIGDAVPLADGPTREDVTRYYSTLPEPQPCPFFNFIQTMAYGCPGRTIETLYQIARRTPLFPQENVYITGICAHIARLPVIFDSSFVIQLRFS